MEKENLQENELTGSQLLKEELLDLEDVDALLEQVMKDAEEMSESPKETVSDEEFRKMDTIMEQASQGVPMDDEILSMLKALEEEEGAEPGSLSGIREPQITEGTQLSGAEEIALLDDTELSETNPGEGDPQTKKKSFLARLFAALFGPKIEKAPDDGEENGQIELSDADILATVTEEGPLADKKNRKKKKKRDKKDKKGKAGNVTSADDNDAIAAELAQEDAGKKGKKEKKKKEKKEKPAKKEKETKNKEEKPEKSHIGKFGIFATLLFCLTILLGIILLSRALAEQITLHSARVAFYEKDYRTAMHAFEGYDLNESDEILYKKTLVLYALDVYYEQYTVYEERDLPKESLSALFDGYKECLEKRVTAEQFDVKEEWQLYKDGFLMPLQERYGLSEEEVKIICSMKPLEYTIVLDNLLSGNTYDAVTLDSLLSGKETTMPSQGVLPETDEEAGGVQEPELPDMLPEEEELLRQLQEEQEKLPETDTKDETLFEGVITDGAVILE